jgi:hypothetical protein
MQQITVESSFGQQLRQLAGQAVLCDVEGRALGFFSPLPGQPRAEDLQLEPHLSVAELQAMRKDRRGKPLGEILARFGLV